MPLPTQLQPEEIAWLKAQGIDPSTVTVGGQQDGQGQMSKISAVEARLKAGVGSNIGGGAGALAGGAAGAELGALGGPAAPITIPAGAIIGAGIGALGGGYVGQKAQQAILPEDVEHQLEQEASQAQAQHPLASEGTDIVSSALASGGSFSPATLVRGLRGVVSRTPEDLAALKNIAIQSTINPAINTGLQYATTGQLPSGRDLVGQIAGGALFAKPSALGRWANRPSMEPSAEPIADEKPEETEATPVQPSAWTDKLSNGAPVIDDTAIKQAYMKMFPKPVVTGMSDEDAYAAQTQWRRNTRISVDDMRQVLHDNYIKSQVPETPTIEPLKMASDDVTPNTPVPESELTPDKQAVRATDFQKAQQELLGEQLKNHDANPSDVAKPPPSVQTEVYKPKTDVIKPVSENTIRITAPNMLPSDITRTEVRPPTVDTQAQLTPEQLAIAQKAQSSEISKAGDNRSDAEVLQDKMEGNKGAKYSQPNIPDRPPIYQDLINQQKQLLAQGKAIDEKGQLTPEYLAIWKKVEQLKNKYGSGQKPIQAPLFKMFGDSQLGWSHDKPIDGGVLLGRLRNQLGKDSSEYKYLQYKGIENFLYKARTSKELNDWIQNNAPKVEVRKFGEGSLSPERKEYNQLYHEFDSIHDPHDNTFNWTPEQQAKRQRLQYLQKVVDKEPISNSSHWQSIAPKSEQDMPGYVEIAVLRPDKRADKSLLRYADPNYKESTHEPQFHSSHNFPPNTLAFVRGYMENVGGKKVFHIIEVQSDWAQRARQERETFKDNPEFLKKHPDGSIEDPLLPHYERLALKAAIDHARSEGADAIAISDAETAMMTEGHDRYRGGEYAQGIHDDALKQVEQQFGKGMRLHYDRTLPKIAEELTGEKGVKQSFGEHRMAWDMPRGNAEHPVEENAGVKRKDLIFRNEKGEPKTDVSGKVYDISHLNPKEFSIFGSDKYKLIQSGLSDTTSMWQTPRDVAEHILNDKNVTTGSVLGKLAKHPEHPFGAMAKWLYENMDAKSRQVPWENNLRSRSRYNLPSEGDNVEMSMTQVHSAPVVIEEALHSMTSAKLPKEWEGLRGSELHDAMTDYLKNGKDNSIKELINSYIHTAQQMGIHNALFVGKGLYQNGNQISGIAGSPDAAHSLNLPYAMGDLHEYIAHTFSDFEFQHKLNNMSSGLKTGGTMWQRLVESIRNLLGLPVNANSMLDRVLRSSAQLIKTERENNNAIQKQGSSGIFSHSSEATGKAGSEREGMGQDNKREEIARKSETNTRTEQKNLPLGINKLFRAGLDTIRSLAHPAANHVADSLQKVFQTRENILGEQLNPIIDTAHKVNLNGRDQEQLDKVMRYELENKKPAPDTMFSSPRQKAVYQAAKKSLLENYNRRLKNEEPVIRNGVPTLPKRDPFYWPTTTNPKVAQVLRDNTNIAEIAKLQKMFTDYQTRMGVKPDEALNNWKDFNDAIQGSSVHNDVGNAVFFNAARRQQGISLPPEFTRPGFLKNLEAYFHAQSTDNAYYEHVEKDPKTMAALGYTKDAWNNPVEPLKEGKIIGNTAVKNVVNEIRGEVLHGMQGQTIAKAESLATATILGPLTEFHKVVSNWFKQLTYTDNPYQASRVIAHAITNWGEGWTHAKENGKVVMTARSASDMWKANTTAADKLAGLGRGIRQIYTLNDLTEKLNLGSIQAMNEALIPYKIQRANEGNATAQSLMKHLDPDWAVGKQYDDKQITQLASNLAGVIHGTRDARTLPSWMLHDNEISSFFKLSSWGFAQTNSFMRDVYTPALKGDITPLINAVFGAAIGGYVLKDLRERLAGKRSQIPSLQEIAASDRGRSGNIPAIAYNMMAAASYAGFGGMLSTIGRYPFDFAFKNTPQGATFPLDTVISETAQTVAQASEAIANDPNLNWGEIGAHVASKLLGTNFQLGRVAMNHAINEGWINGTVAEQKQLSDKLGQLRRFDMVEGLPYNSQAGADENPFMNLEQKAFKRDQNVGEAIQMIPQLVSNIMQTYGQNPDVMMDKLKSLKENMYDTFPSMEKMPLLFIKYLGYLQRYEGPEKAQSELQDYMSHKVTNEVKSSAVP